MQSISVKTSLSIAFTAIAILTGGILTSCSTASQTQNPVPNSTSSHTGAENHTNHSNSTEHGTGKHQDMAMDLGPTDTNYDLRFIDAMTLHHQGAVDMAKEAQQKSQRSEIKQLASDIINEQNKEMGQFKQWRQAWYPQAGNELVAYGGASKSTVPMSEQQHRSMMMSQDLGAGTAEFDLRFINAMIPHHEGAIQMAKDALTKSQRSEIKKLSQTIIDSQQKEIEQMKQWQETWQKQ